MVGILTHIHQSKMSMKDNFKKYYLENVLFYNNQNIEKINNVISKKECYLGNITTSLNSPALDYLKNIIGRIEEYNNKVKAIEYTSETKLEDYRRAIFKYKTSLLFGKLEQSYYVYEEIIYLSQGLLDPIGNGKKLGLIMSSFMNRQGGNKDLKIYNKNIGLYDNISANISYNEYREIINGVRDKSISDAIRICLYYNLYKIEKDEINLYNALQNLYNLTYIFYDYTCKTVINDVFISTLISLYMDNKLQSMSLEEYENRLNKWYKTVEDAARKIIEDNENIEDDVSIESDDKDKDID